MPGRIRRLGTETAVYGVSTVVGRFLTFLLTPLYANLLIPGDLGVVATLYAYIAFLNVVYHYGMDVAYMKYVSTGEVGTRKLTFTAPFTAVTLTSFLFSSVIWFLADPIAVVSGAGETNGVLVRYSALILFLDSVSHVPFAVLRMDRKAKRFAAIRIAGIVAQVVFSVWFLVGLEMGISGIFLAGVLSSGLNLALLVPTIAANLVAGWSWTALRRLVEYGLPTLPAGLAAIALQVVDRPILEMIAGQDAVGVYQANYRLGIFMMLVVSMFEFAWRPFFFASAKEPDAPRLFARVFTYLIVAMTGLFMVLTFFLEDLATAPLFFGYSILPEPYRPGFPVVVPVLLGYMFLGASTVFSAPLYIEKKTKLLPIVTVTGAAVNILANLLLIPLIGLLGAGYATLIGYAAMAVLMFILARRVMPVPYEWRRIAQLLGVGGITFAAGSLIALPIPATLWHLLLLAASLLVLRLMKFFEKEEIAAMVSILRRSKGTVGDKSEM